MHYSVSVLLAYLLALPFASILQALPIGFGTPPAGLEYDELKSKNFYVYHDRRAPNEARAVLNTLEAAKPHLESWFARRRRSPLPVIMSAATDNASFANFITDAIEIQSLGQAHRDLAWHEYVHTSMYRHFQNWLGPAGSVLHLVWLPSWYVEGLAEALSVSVGSDQQALIEAYHATTKRWPTYARMHSLYGHGSFGYRGYAAAGAFVAYLLRDTNAYDLPNLLNEFFHKSMPWYWPYSLLPFKSSMPLDNSLTKITNRTGEELYADYKKAAEAHWAVRAKQLWSVTPPVGEKYDFPNAHSLRVEGRDAYIARYDHYKGETHVAKLGFDRNGWANQYKKTEIMIEDTYSSTWTKDGATRYVMQEAESMTGHKSYKLLQYHVKDRDGAITYFQRPGYPSRLLKTQSTLTWQEQDTEVTRICHVKVISGEVQEADQVQCSVTATQSSKVDIIGWQYYPTSSNQRVVRYVYVKRSMQSLNGDRFEIVRIEPDSMKTDTFTSAEGGEPISITADDKSVWALFAERNKRSIRRLDPENLNCMESADIGTLIFQIQANNRGELAAPIFNGDDSAILKFSPTKSLRFAACQPALPHTSPLLVAMQSGKKISLRQAVAESSIWKETSATSAPTTTFTALTEQKNLATQVDETSQPSRWRVRPVFAVPWLGADSDGAQLGILSVPLMDHMQNEDIRAYFGYGLYSRYPNTEVSFTTTRFWPTLKIDVFRYQTWNGRYFVFDDKSRPSVSAKTADDQGFDSDDGFYDYAYMDERGARLTTTTYFHNIQTTLTLGLKFSHLKRYIGPADTVEGHLNEPFFEISKTSRWGAYRFMHAFMVRAAPEQMNENFDYNSLGFETALSRDFEFLDSSMRWSIEGSRVRGKSRRDLQEVYRPLKIFVAGSGGGYNNLNFPLYGSGALFYGSYGDTQARIDGNYSFPLIKNVDKLMRLLYWDALTFTAFANAGGAWTGAYDKSDEEPSVAHGYAMDAHFDVKGVNFHVGTGVGQVLGYFPDLYASFSFDAIF